MVSRAGWHALHPRLLAEDDGRGRLAVSWTVAGGALAGGVWPALLVLTGRLGSAGLPAVAGRLFLMGALVGFVHGVALGRVSGRPGAVRRPFSVSFPNALFWSAVAATAAWTPTFWMVLSGPVASQGGAPERIGAVSGWLVGGALVAWAVWEGGRAMARFYARWPSGSQHH